MTVQPQGGGARAAPAGADDAATLVGRAARRNLVLGAVILLLKLGAWWQTRSVALLADALESIVNVAAGAVAAFALWWASRPPDRKHPFGHTKAEYLSAALEGALVIAAAAIAVRESWRHLLAPHAPNEVGLGLALAGAAGLANAGMAFYLQRLGRRRQSPALLASAAHLWGDVMTTAGVLAGLLAAWYTGHWAIDPFIALLVAVNIVRLGWQVVRESLGGLLDESLPSGELAHVEALIAREMGGALQVHGLKTRRAGPRRFVELHLVVPGAMRVDAAHGICDRIEDALQEALPGTEVVIHVEPESHLEDEGAPGHESSVDG